MNRKGERGVAMERVVRTYDAALGKQMTPKIRSSALLKKGKATVNVFQVDLGKRGVRQRVRKKNPE